MATPRMRMPTDKKISLLKEIRDQKEVLFGKFSSDIDNDRKSLAWNEILLKAKSLQLVNEGRDSTFVRDNFYGIWKSRALEKRDNKKKTGKGGGREKVLGALDHLIFEIIGTETLVLDGLPIGETGDPVDEFSEAQLADDLLIHDVDGKMVTFTIGQPEPSVPSGSHFTPKKPPSSKSRPFQKRQQLAFEKQQTVKKRKLQCDLMEIKIHKHRLEALKLERELKLSLSPFTQPLFDTENTDENDLD